MREESARFPTDEIQGEEDDEKQERIIRRRRMVRIRSEDEGSVNKRAKKGTIQLQALV